jgi:hypothetical protein
VWGAFIHANDSVGPSSYHSVLLIDGVQQGGLGRMVAQRSSASACFATADWAPAYNRHVTARNEKPTYNDYHPLAPFAAPFADWRGEFSWRDPWSKTPPPATWQAKPVYEVDHAFRTIGLVRGPHPYVLVIDDVRKDNSVHLYEWFMQVESDVVVASMANRKIAEFEFMDIILASERDARPGKPDSWAGQHGHRTIRQGAPCLLVRVLNINVDKKHQVPLPGVLETWNNVPWWPNTELKPVGKRLKIQTWAVEPEFRVLMFPHRHGEELPKSSWERKREVLRVTWADQMDEYTFDYTPQGRPTFVLEHSEPGRRVEDTFRFGVEIDAVEGVLDADEKAQPGM